MIIGLSYNVFNGEEHLLHSLRTMRPLANYINVVSQDVSNVGNPASPRLYEVIAEAHKLGLFDKLIGYAPDLSLPAHRNEFEKRRLGFLDCQRVGVSHFMTMDCDEYYVADEFRNAVEQIRERGAKLTIAPTYLHIKRPIWRSELPDSTCIQFLTEIDSRSDYSFGSPWPRKMPVDPTRRLHGDATPYICFEPSLVSMRHMNLVRHSLDSKLANTSSAHMHDFIAGVRSVYENWKFQDILYFPNKPPMNIIEVPDLFGIDQYFR